MKKQLSLIMFYLLVVLTQSATAQRNGGTKSQPEFPTLPYTITYTAAPTGGSVSITIPGDQPVESGATIYNGTVVTLTTMPDDKYKPTVGYPKAHKADDETPVTLAPVSNSIGVYTFDMPSYPVTIDMQYTAKSVNANLVALTYTIGDGEAVPVGNFSPDETSYDVTLPDDTDPAAVICLSGESENEFATLPEDAPTVTLSDGKGTISLTVTAEDGSEQTYTLNFTVPKYAINFKTPQNGALSLSANEVNISNGDALFKGAVVTLTTKPDAGYQASLGYPKLYRTGSNPKEPISCTTTGGIRTFTMPAFPITIEMQYEALPSNEARLSSISYQISGQEGTVTLPNFNSSVLNQTIVLPAKTTGTITLTGKRMDGNTDATTTCEITGGTATATLTVTAQDGKTTKTYTLTFTVAPDDSYIVTLASDIVGGTIAAVQPDGKAVRSGDAVKGGTELTLSNTPVKGYKFDGYSIKSKTTSDNKLTVTEAVTISATFTPTDAVSPEIGTPAIPEVSGEDPKPAKDAPIIIIPDINALPSDTELSELQLIKDEPTDENQTKIEDVAKSSGIAPSNMEVVEITLVKVTTIIGSDGQETTSVTPVQPNDQVKVRIPYPAGKNKKSYDFTILHLKSDGTIETYSTKNGLLSLQDNYMELTIVSFSPFGISWKAKSTPPPYIPSYYDITLPEVAGVTLSETAGKHSVVEYSNFSFTLTVNEGYKQQSEPVVRISRNNEVLTPRQSDGKYVITNIDRDITVTIEGIVKDPDEPDEPDEPVSNETISTGMRVWTENNSLHVSTDTPAEANVYTLAGSLKHRFLIQTGDNRFTLEAGIYIVRIQDKAFKILLY